MPPLCTVDVAPTAAQAVVARLAGELDLSNVDEIETRLLGAVQSGHVLILDLSELSYVDSSGLGMIERLTHQTPLRLVLPAEAVIARTLTITGLDQVVDVYATQAAALAQHERMPQPIEPRHYDDKIAQSLSGPGADALLTGLPAYLGIRTIEMGPARMVAELDVREELLNPFGSAHGGVLAGLVDHVLGMVLYPVIERGKWAATTEFKLNLIAAVRTGTLRAEAIIVAMSRTTAVVHVEVTNDGKLAGLAQGTVLIPEKR